MLHVAVSISVPYTMKKCDGVAGILDARPATGKDYLLDWMDCPDQASWEHESNVSKAAIAAYETSISQQESQPQPQPHPLSQPQPKPKRPFVGPKRLFRASKIQNSPKQRRSSSRMLVLSKLGRISKKK